MTPEEARDLLDGTTPAEDWWYSVKWGRVRHLEPVGIDAAGEMDVSEDDAALIVAAPTLAALAAGMRTEYRVDRMISGHWTALPLGLNTPWTDDKDRADGLAALSRAAGRTTRIVRRYVTTEEETS